jgi:hypothetical protein
VRRVTFCLRLVGQRWHRASSLIQGEYLPAFSDTNGCFRSLSNTGDFKELRSKTCQLLRASSSIARRPAARKSRPWMAKEHSSRFDCTAYTGRLSVALRAISDVGPRRRTPAGRYIWGTGPSSSVSSELRVGQTPTYLEKLKVLETLESGKAICLRKMR